MPGLKSRPIRLRLWAGAGIAARGDRRYYRRMLAWNDLSPLQLGRRFAVGTAVAAAAGGSVFILLPWQGEMLPRYRWELLSSVALMLLGKGITVRAERTLRRGISADRWAAQELLSLRRWANVPGLQLITNVGFVSFFICLAAGTISPHLRRAVGVGLPLYILADAISRLQKAVAVPVPRQPIGPMVIKPLQSEHWGDPGAMGCRRGLT